MLDKKIRKQKLNELRASVGNSLRNARVEQKIMLIDAAEDLFCRARTLDSIECGTSSKISLDALVYMAAYYDKVVTIHINKYVPTPESSKSDEEDTVEDAPLERLEETGEAPLEGLNEEDEDENEEMKSKGEEEKEKNAKPL